MIILCLPDMDFCRRRGWVQFPDPATARLITRDGRPRKIRLQALSATEYTREHRARFYQCGLTARGTARKNQPRAPHPTPDATL